MVSSECSLWQNATPDMLTAVIRVSADELHWVLVRIWSNRATWEYTNPVIAFILSPQTRQLYMLVLTDTHWDGDIGREGMEQSLQRSGPVNEVGRERGRVGWSGWGLAIFYFLARRGRRHAFILFCINSVIQIQAVCSFSLCEYCISRKGNKTIRQVGK